MDNENTLANKYRPQAFEDMVGQEVNRKVLTTQINNKTYSHSMLFAGGAGSGKTTSAKIFARMIDAEVFELDCATHSSVNDIREIVDNARRKSLIHEYKCFVLDECHQLSSAAWDAFLLTLEENFPNTIFILCTTDTQKIPDTIISRLQRYNFAPLTRPIIIERLKYVCKEENIEAEESALNCIAKTSKGNMRQALTNLDMCLLYGDITLENVQKVLNVISDDVYRDLYNAIVEHNDKNIIHLINSFYKGGYNLHFAMRQFLDYLLTFKADIRVIDTMLTVLQDIRYDNSPRTLIIARLLTWGLRE